MVKVFLVDDHEVVRRGLIDLLSADPELEVIGEAGSVAQALARIPALQPDVAVLDVRLPDGNGIELCRELLSRLPDLRCLMLTSFTSDEAMLDAILAGASGYVVKDIKGMELAEAIKEVGAGRSLLDNRAAAALMAKLRGAAEKSDPLAGLSDQERVLLDLLGEGLTNKQIAARMFLAEKTVKNYVSRLLAKLGMERRTQAAVFVSKLDQSHRHPIRGIGRSCDICSGLATHEHWHACRLRNSRTDRTQQHARARRDHGCRRTSIAQTDVSSTPWPVAIKRSWARPIYAGQGPTPIAAGRTSSSELQAGLGTFEASARDL